MSAFLIGNGKSLRKTPPWDIPKRFDTYGVNLLPKLYRETDWRPTYYCVFGTSITIGEYKNLILTGMRDSIPLLSKKVQEYLDHEQIDSPASGAVVQTYEYPIEWSTDPKRGFCTFGMSHHVTAQIAAHIHNHKRIYLVGFDLNFRRPPVNGPDESHFTSDYWGEFQRTRPDPIPEFYETMNRDHLIAHKSIAKAAKRHGFQAISCTPDSPINDVYPYQPFEEVISG